ncbi:MAG: RsmE family RNA methyltransferase [Acidimicrobiales bacterium]
MTAAAHVFVTDLDRPSIGEADRRHLSRVLRLRPGEAVSLADGSGGWRLARWDGRGELAPAGDVERRPRPDPMITIAFAVVKGDRSEWAVQKLTELGVDRIVPMVSERVVVRWDGTRAAQALARWRTVARAAAMQARLAWLPDVTEVTSWADVAATGGGLGDGGGGAVVAVPGGGPLRLDRPTVLIGPEGGWAPHERDCGLPTAGLGPTVLRAETAAVAAAVLLVALRSGVVSPTPRVPDGADAPPRVVRNCH